MPRRFDPRTERWRRDVLVGVAVLLPLALLALLVWEVASALVRAGRWIAGALARVGIVEPPLVAAVLLVAALAVPTALVAVGLVVRHRYGRRVVRLVDRVVESVPGLGPVYQGLRRSREVLAAPEGDAFAGVVRVRLDDGVRALAFRVDRRAEEVVGQAAGAADDAAAPASEPEAEDGVASHVDALDAPDLATVFVPFAPNPVVGGHLLTVELDRIEETDLTVPEALGVLVGLGSHDDPPEPGVPLESFYLGVGGDDASEAGVGAETEGEPTATD